MRELKKQICLRWDEMLLMLGLNAGAFLAGEILLAFVMQVEEQDTVIELGTLMALSMAVMLMLFIGIGIMGQCFNIGVSMGTVRRRLVPMYLAVTYAECLMEAGILFLLYRLESWLLQLMYPQLGVEAGVDAIFQWKYIFIVSAVITACNVFFGMLFLKFGKAAYIVLWILWVGIFYAAARISTILEEYSDTPAAETLRSVLDFFQSMTENGILAAITGVSLLLVLISWIMLRKQQVKI